MLSIVVWFKIVHLSFSKLESDNQLSAVTNVVFPLVKVYFIVFSINTAKKSFLLSG